MNFTSVEYQQELYLNKEFFTNLGGYERVEYQQELYLNSSVIEILTLATNVEYQQELYLNAAPFCRTSLLAKLNINKSCI